VPVKFTSYLQSIEKDLSAARNRVLTECGKMNAQKMKEKAKPLFQKKSGNLLKGLTYQFEKGGNSIVVGAGTPAYHAHLLEFGTIERTQKKQGKFQIASIISTKKGIYRRPVGGKVGKITAKPFILPTLQENINESMSILSQRWID